MTFTGKAAEGLLLQSYSPLIDESQKELGNLTLTFNEDVKVSADAVAKVTCRNEEYAASTSVTAEGNTVTIGFDNVPLYYLSTYTVELPEGVISSVETDETYKAITLTYKGASYKYASISNVSPADGSEVSYLNTVSLGATFEDGMVIHASAAKPLDFKLYEGDHETGTLIGTYAGEYNTSLDGISVEIKKFDLKPNTAYTLYLEEGTFTGYNMSTSSSSSLYRNSEIVLTYHTAADMPEFAGVTPSSAEAVEGSKNTLRVIVPGYEFEGTTYAAKLQEGASGVSVNEELYYNGNVEVSNKSYYLTVPVYSGDEKVTDAKLLWGANPNSDYEVWLTASLDKVLYSDKEYRVAIPAGVLAPNAEMASFAGNKEVTLTFNGNAAHTLNITCDNLKSGAVVGELNSLMFTADEPLIACTALVLNVQCGKTSKDYPMTMLTTSDNATCLFVNLTDGDGNSFVPEAGEEGTLTIAANMLNSNSDPKLSNGKITIPFVGAVPETVEPEQASVTLTVGDNASTTSAAVKGKPYTVTVTPEADWSVETLTVNGEDVTAEMADGSYTIAELAGDAEIRATLAYAGDLAFADETTGIATVEGTGVSAYSNGSEIVVEGLTAGDAVAVYTVGGQKLASHAAAGGTVRISAPTGSTYIVKVNRHAIKLAH